MKWRAVTFKTIIKRSSQRKIISFPWLSVWNWFLGDLVLVMLGFWASVQPCVVWLVHSSPIDYMHVVCLAPLWYIFTGLPSVVVYVTEYSVVYLDPPCFSRTNQQRHLYFVLQLVLLDWLMFASQLHPTVNLFWLLHTTAFPKLFYHDHSLYSQV